MKKALTFVIISGFAAAGVLAQTPAPQPESRAFSLFYTSEGGYLGIQSEDVNKDNFSKYGLREVRGVAIEKVMENSPAAAAGLQAGDVIVKFNGEEVASVRKLTRLISEVAPDHQVRITVLRSGAERELTATLGKQPTPMPADGAFQVRVPGRAGTIELPRLPQGDQPRIEAYPPQAPLPPAFEGFTWRAGNQRQIGVGVTSLTKQLADHFGVAGGLLINNVRENSPAAKAGLRAGDIIVEADGKALKGDFDLIRTIAEKKDGDIALTIVRNRDRQTIRVTPEEVKGNPNEFFEFREGSFPQTFTPGVQYFQMPRNMFRLNPILKPNL